MNKSHHTAVVIVLPERVWAGIQAIRHRYDRQVGRWMPHVTLLYPFRPREEFDEVEPALRERACDCEPFKVALAEFSWFRHGRGRYTMWLRPEPAEPIVRLQTALMQAVPDCDDVARFASGFTPHLSVGQRRGKSELERTLAELSAEFEPVRFVVDRVAMIRRSGEAGGPFEVDRWVALGGAG